MLSHAEEVDDSLEDEIGQECSKYGQISQITIFEVTEPGYNPEEAVRHAIAQAQRWTHV